MKTLKNFFLLLLLLAITGGAIYLLVEYTIPYLVTVGVLWSLALIDMKRTPITPVRPQ